MHFMCVFDELPIIVNCAKKKLNVEQQCFKYKFTTRATMQIIRTGY